MSLPLAPEAASDRAEQPAGRLCIGTAGWSYADWYGSFYPSLPKPRGFDELTFYAAHFDFVEVNTSYYRIPSPRTVEGWAARTPDGFTFAVKAYGALTHDLELASAATFQEFLTALAPLRATGKLGCILLQFPPAFQPAPASQRYLRGLAGLLDGLPLAIEFRHRSWVAPARVHDTIALLQTHGLGFVNLDEPALAGNMPPTSIRTSPLGYVRFHGRNARWTRPTSARRVSGTTICTAGPSSRAGATRSTPCGRARR
ncbi:MAG: DUF72 domain-containing protein [Actinobacteria bacterium]|nr:DUF72 domain-containing protein [Actinomycetota bacterium]